MNWARNTLTNEDISGIEFAQLSYAQKGMIGRHLLCPTCSEQVTFVDRNDAPHFKHQSGNNNIDCESYIPFTGFGTGEQYGRIPMQSISGFDTRYRLRYEQKLIGSGFYLYIKLTQEQLLNSQSKKESIAIHIYNNSEIIGTQTYLISTSSFMANEYKAIKLEKFGQYIELETPYGTEYIDYLANVPAFQILGSDDLSVFSAKQIDKKNGRQIFINSNYLLFSRNLIYNLANFANVIKTSKIISDDFNEYYVYHVVFTERSPATLKFCSENGFILCNEEASMFVLWPPVENINGENVFTSEKIFLKTNFNFVFGETINTRNFDNATKSISVKLGEEIIVACRNSFESFVRYGKEQEIKESLPEPIIEYAEKPSIEVDSNNAFLFSINHGVHPVACKQNLKLTYDHEIRYFNANYLVRCICLKPENQVDYVTDVLRYNKVDESFIPEDNEYYGRNIFFLNYLMMCRKTGRINSFIKKMIREDI